MSKKVIVIGAGAAGLLAAGKAGERGLEVVLAEKNDRVGKKLLISGKGRCNITNNTDINGLIENIPGNGIFLYSAFYNFSNMDLINFLNEHGLNTKVERGGRIFPVSDIAGDVVDTIYKYTVKSGDSFWSISQKFPGVSDKDIMKANNMSNPKGLRPGMVIKIPKP